jgi:ATP-dependent DNA helicase RecQ
MANLLRQRGINALPFHAELSKLEKDDAQTRWKAGDVECIVATVAFGMVSKKTAQ